MYQKVPQRTKKLRVLSVFSVILCVTFNKKNLRKSVLSASSACKKCWIASLRNDVTLRVSFLVICYYLNLFLLTLAMTLLFTFHTPSYFWIASCLAMTYYHNSSKNNLQNLQKPFHLSRTRTFNQNRRTTRQSPF